MNFVLSFSGGKDSVLALHELVAAGHVPVALMAVVREEAGRTWTHGIDFTLLAAMAEALDVPLLRCAAGAETYNADVERTLLAAGAMGAEACAFGDIDLIEHRAWDEERCAAVGLAPLLPLWGRDREENVRRAVELGYVCVIKCVRSGVLPPSLLGRPLSEEVLDEMRSYGVDLCGEGGEYHTIVVDGPLFRRPVPLENRGTIVQEYITAADLVLKT